MKERGALIGSLVAGLLASACCIGPLALGVLGLGSLGLGAALEPYRPWFLVVTGVFLAFGFYVAYRRSHGAPCEPGEACAVSPASRRSQRIILWIVVALTIGVATYPNWGAAFYRPRALNASAVHDSVVTLGVTGMSCAACGASIEKALRAVPGVSTAHVDYDMASAQPNNTRSSPGGDAMVSLKASLAPLVADFNAVSAGPRFVAILSPTCPGCVHGVAAIKSALLDPPDSTTHEIFIIWTPMVPGDNEASTRQVMVSLRYPGVRHYYDPENRVGRAFRAEVFPASVSQMRSSVPADHFISASLRTRDADAPEWDIYMFFDAGVLWNATAPPPSRWVRQVAQFGEPGKDLASLMWRNSYKSPPIEGDLAKELAAMAPAGTGVPSR